MHIRANFLALAGSVHFTLTPVFWRLRVKGLKEELAWAMDKQLRVVSNEKLFKQLYATKKLKKKAVLNLKQYCMHYYVTLSNVL